MCIIGSADMMQYALCSLRLSAGSLPGVSTASLTLAHGQRFPFRSEARNSTIRNEGYLQDFELHRYARSGPCHGTDVFTDSVPALLSSVTQ